VHESRRPQAVDLLAWEKKLAAMLEAAAKDVIT
jgi:hypothetical protein